jgi:hypothetical protein
MPLLKDVLSAEAFLYLTDGRVSCAARLQYGVKVLFHSFRKLTWKGKNNRMKPYWKAVSADSKTRKEAFYEIYQDAGNRK